MPLQYVTFCKTDEIPPGKREVFDLESGDSILLLNIDGSYYAVDNICSHEEYELVGGELNGCELECPQHGAWFDVRSGEVLAPPATRPIAIYAVQVENDDVQILLDLPEAI